MDPIEAELQAILTQERDRARDRRKAGIQEEEAGDGPF